MNHYQHHQLYSRWPWRWRYRRLRHCPLKHQQSRRRRPCSSLSSKHCRRQLSVRFTNSVRLPHVVVENGPKCRARRIHRQYVGASFRFVFASLRCPFAKAFGPYLIRAAGRGLSNAAKVLLFVANPSRQIATNYRIGSKGRGCPRGRWPSSAWSTAGSELLTSRSLASPPQSRLAAVLEANA